EMLDSGGASVNSVAQHIVGNASDPAKLATKLVNYLGSDSEEIREKCRSALEGFDEDPVPGLIRILFEGLRQDSDQAKYIAASLINELSWDPSDAPADAAQLLLEACKRGN